MTENQRSRKPYDHTAKVLGRRLMVYLYHSQGLNAVEITRFTQRAKFTASERTIRRDIESMDLWLPHLVNLKGEADKSAAKILGRLELGQQRLLQLAYSAGNPNAQVGAAKGLIEAAMKEADFRINAGQFTQAPFKADVEVSVPGFSIKGLLAEFGEPIIGEILRRRLGPDRGLPGPDPEESLDSSDADIEAA